ncbi:MAG: GNAT family N-acetyltransferase [Anaerolineales bacterium]|nr:GNAT family N-acetyltransferase [Anaerolineales bacterium]
MEIRRSLSDDLDVIVSFDHVAQEQSARRDFIKRSIDNKEAYVVIESSSIVGYAVIDYSFFDNGFISMLYIAPSHRHQGYGSALVRYIERICKTPKLFTSTNESNVIMQALLEKLGFHRSGWIDNLDEGDPELVYFKWLGNEAR